MAEPEDEPYEIKIYWAIALACVGATLLFFGLVLVKGFPRGPEWWINLWPVASVGGLLFSGRLLLKYYRHHRSARQNFRLSLGDMVLSFMLFGTIPALYQKADPPFLGFLIGMIVLLCILIGFMRATRLGFVRWPARHVFALAHAMRSVGLVGVGAITAISIMATIAGEEPGLLAYHIFGLFDGNYTVALTSYASVAVLLAGVILCRRITRPTPPAAGKPTEPAEESQTARL